MDIEDRVYMLTGSGRRPHAFALKLERFNGCKKEDVFVHLSLEDAKSLVRVLSADIDFLENELDSLVQQAEERGRRASQKAKA